MKKKLLKPTSSYFLSQKFWKILRVFTDRHTWTFLYTISQKIKINSLLSILSYEDLTLINGAKYKNSAISYKNKQKFSTYLKKYNSSKPMGNYRKYLDKLFIRIKQPRTILEFGISEGAGILALKDYFKYSKLWGLDIDKNTFIKDKRIKCGYCDQLKLISIKKILKKFNTKFDLIIDDGWHHPEAQINSIISSLPYLNNDGIYITEDINHDSYENHFSKVIDILNNKKFKVEYRKYYIRNKSSNIAGTSSNGYLTIYRKFK